MEWLQNQGGLVTLDRYLKFNWPDRDFKDNPLTAEELSQIPSSLK